MEGSTAAGGGTICPAPKPEVGAIGKAGAGGSSGAAAGAVGDLALGAATG